MEGIYKIYIIQDWLHHYQQELHKIKVKNLKQIKKLQQKPKNQKIDKLIVD